jgi:hypothetical protein
VTRLGEFKFFGDIFGVVFFEKNPYVENIFRIPHFPGKSYVLIVTKMGWATFWATFSQTHLGTLFGNRFFTVDSEDECLLTKIAIVHIPDILVGPTQKLSISKL